MLIQAGYFLLAYENAPCWYELSWEAESPAILLRVHKDFLSDVQFDKLHLKDQYIEQFGFTHFDSNIQTGNFGFEGVFERTGEDDGFVVFRIAVPVVRKQHEQVCPCCQGQKDDMFGKCPECAGKGITPVPCSNCGGSGKGEFDDECHECGGRGVETSLEWKHAYAISASFTVFFMAASLWLDKSKKSSCKLPQLILVDTVTLQDMHGGSLGGTYSVPLVRWLSAFRPDTEMVEMAEAMKTAWRRMFGELRDYEEYSFWAKVAYKNGWLNVSCPGDACGLHPSDGNISESGVGYEFSCHNVDTPMQQITLLSSLAALCTRARKEIKSY